MTSVTREARSQVREVHVDRLDDLLDRSADDLRTLYENATVPRLDSIKGDLRGRMLAVVALPRVAPLLASFARSDRFPWRGKSFTPHGIDRGEGINRVISDRFRLYRFETSIGPSRAGDFDAVQLDYDLKENPFFIRRIKDEIRMIAPSVYLGQAYVQGRKRTRLFVYFGLEG